MGLLIFLLIIIAIVFGIAESIVNEDGIIKEWSKLLLTYILNHLSQAFKD